MAATRARILDEARRIVTRDGVAAMTARSLAAAASVSVATLYSLVGKREDVLSALFAQSQERVQERMAAHGAVEGLAAIELLATEAAALFGEDEEYYRAAQLAMEHLDDAPIRAETVVAAYRLGDAMICHGFRQCAEGGQLSGRIPFAILGDMAIQCYRSAYRRWASGHLSIDEVRRLTLAHSYAILMSDAIPDFRRELARRIEKMNSGPLLIKLDSAALLDEQSPPPG